MWKNSQMLRSVYRAALLLEMGKPRCDTRLHWKATTNRSTQGKQTRNWNARPFKAVHSSLWADTGHCFGVSTDLPVVLATTRPERYWFHDTWINSGNSTIYQEMREFAKQCRFTHITSSLHYPQVNSEAENAVRTVKNLLKNSPTWPYSATELPQCPGASWALRNYWWDTVSVLTYRRSRNILSPTGHMWLISTLWIRSSSLHGSITMTRVIGANSFQSCQTSYQCGLRARANRPPGSHSASCCTSIIPSWNTLEWSSSQPSPPASETWKYWWSNQSIWASMNNNDTFSNWHHC